MKNQKGKKDLAGLYPPYDKITRGDVIAGRIGKKKKMQDWTVYHQLGIHLAEALGVVAEQKEHPDKEEAERFSKMSDKQLKERPGKVDNMSGIKAAAKRAAARGAKNVPQSKRPY
jgi:hypothetical protein